MRSIFQIGPSVHLNGGISTIIKEISNSSNIKERYDIKVIESIGKNRILTFLKSIIKVREIKKGDIAHFHVASKGSFFRKYILFRLVNKEAKVIFHLHGGKFIEFYNDSNETIKRCIRKMLNDSDIIINVSNYMKDELNRTFPFVVDKNISIYNGVYVNRDVVNIEEKENILLFMGKVVEYKGVYDLIDILYFLKDDLLELKWKVIIAGDGETEKLKSLVNKYKLDNVDIIGWVSGDKKEKLLRKSKIMLVPSHIESFGIAAVEGMAYGNAIIANNVGALPEIIKNGQNGYVVKNNNKNEFSNSILELINNPDKMKMISNNNIKDSLNFKFDNMINNLMDQYEKI